MILMEYDEKWKMENLVSDILSLSNYFLRMLKDNYEILSIEQEEFSFLYRLNTLFPIVEFFMKNYKGFTFLPHIFRTADNMIRSELDKETPFLTPLGFKLEEEEHFEFILNTIFYHYEKQAFSLLKLFLKQGVPDREIEKLLKENLKDVPWPIKIQGITENQIKFFKKILSNFIDTEELKNDLISQVPELINFSEPELYIEEYSHTFDLLFSFFIEPLEETRTDKKSKKAKDSIRRILDNVDQQHHYFFEELDATLRNAFVHKNYLINNENREIVYFQRHSIRGKIANKYKIISYQKLITKTIQIKISLLALLQATIMHFMRTSREFSRKLIPYFLIWKPESDSDWTKEIFGIAMNDIYYCKVLHKEGKMLDSFLLELKVLMKDWEDLKEIDLKFIKTKPNIISASEKFTTLWSYLKNDKGLMDNLKIIFGYYLFLLSLDEDYERNIIGFEKLTEGMDSLISNSDLERMNLEMFLLLSSKSDKRAQDFYKNAMEIRKEDGKDILHYTSYKKLIVKEKLSEEELGKIPNDLIIIYIFNKLITKIPLSNLVL